MLIQMFGAITAAAVAPLIDLTDTTPAFWNQPPLQKLLPFRIAFPDGMTWTFDGIVIAEKVIDGVIDLTIRPSGMVRAEPVIVQQDPWNVPGKPMSANPVMLTIEGHARGEVWEIKPIDITDFVPALPRRIGDLTLILTQEDE